ncbi:MAG TPA: hypothetical protein P5079_00220 [Elusimicrobiota bacterium]|nr:hypothetical protein [Elusimicrobiota bacterium]
MSHDWRLLHDGALSGEENMRRDRELLENQRRPDARPTLRFFRWSSPTLTYGKLQGEGPARQAAQAFGAAHVVRRPTGGGMVLHDKNLSLSLTWPRRSRAFPASSRSLYRTVHQILKTALRECGTETSFFVPETSRKAGPGLCFSEPVTDDLMWRGKKVAGGALRATRWGFLYEGDVRTELVDIAPEMLIEKITAAFRNYFSKG